MAEPFAAWRQDRRISFKRWWAFALIFAWGAPAALWFFALLVSFGLSSHACYPAGTPIARALWSDLPVWLRIFNIACLVVSLAALIAGTVDWRVARRPQEASRSGAGDPRAALEGALAKASALAAIVLWIGLFVNGTVIWIISHCGPA